MRVSYLEADEVGDAFPYGVVKTAVERVIAKELDLEVRTAEEGPHHPRDLGSDKEVAR